MYQHRIYQHFNSNGQNISTKNKLMKVEREHQKSITVTSSIDEPGHQAKLFIQNKWYILYQSIKRGGT